MSSDQSPITPWRAGPRREIARTRIFTLYAQHYDCPDDPSCSDEFSVIESPDWMNVVAITPDRRAVLVEQFRYGAAQVTLEPVAGMVEPGEDPMHTARRELAEETGYASENAPVRIGQVHANPAIMDNTCHFALIEGAEPTARTSFDVHEQIRTRLVPIDDVPGLIRSGTITHSLAVCAFHFYFDHIRAGT